MPKVRFILGRSGSGKTVYCLNRVKEELDRSELGPPLIILVPEQATYQTDRALVSLSSKRGYMRAFSLSFRRLAYRILRETGGIDLPFLGDLGKEMMLSAVLREKEDDLRIFHRAARKPGFFQYISRSLSELRHYGISLESLQQEAAACGDSLLALKAHDLSLLGQAFLEKIQGRFVDPEEVLDILAEKIPEFQWLSGAKVWVDGFMGFTPQEYRVLAALIRAAENVEIALCLDHRRLTDINDDPANLDPRELFFPTEETYLTLKSIFLRDIKFEHPLVLPSEGKPVPRFAGNAVLGHLERALFAEKQTVFDQKVGEVIKIVKAPGRRVEVIEAGREILRLVREKGYRYRDIAIVLRSVEDYHPLIDAVFQDRGIPYFMDRRHPVSHHPAVELVRSAVEVVERGWPLDPVIQYLKTDLVLLSREGVDTLENYVLAHGISGKAWFDEDDWTWNRRSLDEEGMDAIDQAALLNQINSWRREGVSALMKFHEMVGGGRKSVREITGSLYHLLEDLGVSATLEQWAEKIRREGDLVQAEEHAEVWALLVGLLDELVVALGEEKVSLRDYRQILEAGLSRLTLGLIPPSLDQVVVGSIERSRHPDLKAVFVLGVGERLFPTVRSEDPILSDRDREELLKDGLKLGPTSTADLYNEDFLAYIAFTRPRDRLWLSYSVADEKGRELNPSALISRIESLFPEMEVHQVDIGLPLSPEQADTPSELAGALAEWYRGGPKPGGDDRWVEVYQGIISDKVLRPYLEVTFPSLVYKNKASLSSPARDILYGKDLKGSVSSLESFAACPFHYLAQYGLGLRPREEYKIEALDLGALCHAALKAFLDRTIKENRDWAGLEKEEAWRILEEELQELAPRLKREIFFSSSRNQYMLEQARNMLRQAVSAFLAQAETTAFKPWKGEVPFGIGRGGGPPHCITLEQGRSLVLRGKIDRVDLAEGEHGQASLVRVIDYKLNARTLDLNLVYYGLALQLPVYLMVASSSGLKEIFNREDVGPAGAFFSPLTAGIESGIIPRDAPLPGDPKFFKPYKLRGFFNEEWVGWLDSRTEEGYSPYLNFFRKKDGSMGDIKRADYIPHGGMEPLLQNIIKTLKRQAEEIMAGKVEVNPFRMGRATACVYCRYSTLCRIEPGINSFRDLPRFNREEILKKILEQT